MKTTRDEALRLFLSAPEMESRLELTRRLLAICDDCGCTFNSWSAPLYPEFDDLVDSEVIQQIEELFGVVIDDESINAAKMNTFGDFVLFVETQTPPLDTQAKTAIASANCGTQSAFYAIRRAARTAANLPDDARLRPTMRLSKLLANDRRDDFSALLFRQFGVFVRAEKRIFGKWELGATWLALWFVSLLIFVSPIGDILPVVARVIIWFGSGPIIAFVLGLTLRPYWSKQFTTLGDVARHVNAAISQTR